MSVLNLAVEADEPTPCTNDRQRWFSEDPLDVEAAKDACYDCPFLFECALEGTEHEFGVWGGLSAADRDEIDPQRVTLREERLAREAAYQRILDEVPADPNRLPRAQRRAQSKLDKAARIAADRESILEGVRAGFTIAELVELLEFSIGKVGTVVREAKASGEIEYTPRNANRKLADGDLDAMRKLREDGMAYKRIGEQFGVSENTVRRNLLGLRR